MMFRQIFDDELLDEEFFEYLGKKIEPKVMEELQVKYDFSEITKYHHINIGWE